MKCTIMLADDHKVVLEGIRRVLAAGDDFVIVGEAHTGREAVKMATQLIPDIVIMDIGMPLLNGLEACRQIRKVITGCRVVILSAHSDDAYVEQAFRNGAAGFVLKQESGNTLIAAIRAVLSGKIFLSKSINKRFRKQQSSSPGMPMHNKLADLTPREREVLQLIAEGKANKETAWELKISIKTVEKHRTNLMQKLDIHDTASLTRFAIDAGVIESGVRLTVF